MSIDAKILQAAKMMCKMDCEIMQFVKPTETNENGSYISQGIHKCRVMEQNSKGDDNIDESIDIRVVHSNYTLQVDDIIKFNGKEYTIYTINPRRGETSTVLFYEATCQ